MKRMRKIRRFLTVLLFVNFFYGMKVGMEPLNFWLVMLNGIAVVGVALEEAEKNYVRLSRRNKNVRGNKDGKFNC